ncbi:hypothetical protein L3V82_03025 [Thiotrichales bacterium 19S3-7]|nr:hypothetical protein [Thiotrichales bacterium 19S3-7]MCF6801142.1 hypothetical protein [Thiotrichales bacterium 19S3-11]
MTVTIDFLNRLRNSSSSSTYNQWLDSITQYYAMKDDLLSNVEIANLQEYINEVNLHFSGKKLDKKRDLFDVVRGFSAAILVEAGGKLCDIDIPDTINEDWIICQSHFRSFINLEDLNAPRDMDSLYIPSLLTSKNASETYIKALNLFYIDSHLRSLNVSGGVVQGNTLACDMMERIKYVFMYPKTCKKFGIEFPTNDELNMAARDTLASTLKEKYSFKPKDLEKINNKKLDINQVLLITKMLSELNKNELIIDGNKIKNPELAIYKCHVDQSYHEITSAMIQKIGKKEQELGIAKSLMPSLQKEFVELMAEKPKTLVEFIDYAIRKNNFDTKINENLSSLFSEEQKLLDSDVPDNQSKLFFKLKETRKNMSDHLPFFHKTITKEPEIIASSPEK